MHLSRLKRSVRRFRRIVCSSLKLVLSAGGAAAPTEWKIQIEARVVLDERMDRLFGQYCYVFIHRGIYGHLLLSSNTEGGRIPNELDLSDDWRSHAYRGLYLAVESW